MDNIDIEMENMLNNEIDETIKKIAVRRNINVGDPKKYKENDETSSQNYLPERNSLQGKHQPLNQIMYGAPGTGKTYYTAEMAVSIIEGREPVFKKYDSDERKRLMEKYSKAVKSGQITFTTFHQSYGYEDFIQGLRPYPNEEKVVFKPTDGVFKKIVNKAMKDNTYAYVIIIDEINRGNISRIFGELITLIEEDKRWGEVNQLSVKLPLGEDFAVPNNLYIIGTMNSADKSISLIDVALRRRFNFIEIPPDPDMVEDEKLRNIMLKLNDYLAKELKSTDLLIGQAYFINKNYDQLDGIMNNNIIPLLYEYFYDDANKVRKTLHILDDMDYEIDKNSKGRIRIVHKKE